MVFRFFPISETAGLGMKADTDESQNQFKRQKCGEIRVYKTGAASDEQIDALSGANDHDKCCYERCECRSGGIPVSEGR